MQYSKIFSVLVAALSAGQVMASPVAVPAEIQGLNGVSVPQPNPDAPVLETLQISEPAGEKVKRALGNVYMCTASNWGGHCESHGSGYNQCVNMSAYWRYQVSSFGPDSGTYCVLYTCTDCSCSDSGGFGSPGLATMGSYNDNVASYKCWW